MLFKIKKLYLWLFRFMLGKREGKLARFYVHFWTVLIMLVPLIFLASLISYVSSTEVIEWGNIIHISVVTPVGMVLSACMVKLQLRIFF
ncbi:MAG: hypothetical protein FWG87_06470 [Defluviitaleaceae bacterium]|nr:hypothetical protein [Defluviitaleaceae bacterium]